MPKPTVQLCTSCIYFVRDVVGGECHRYPPSGPTQTLLNVWPKTADNSWCGEWRWRGSHG